MSFHQVLDQLLSEAKSLAESSTLICEQHLLYPPFKLIKEEPRGVLDLGVDEERELEELEKSYVEVCKEKWKEITTLRSQIQKLASNNNPVETKNRDLELLKYEKYKLQATINNLKKELETPIKLDSNPLSRNLGLDQKLSDAFTSYQQLKHELNLQIKQTQTKKEKAKQQLTQLTTFSQSLQTKLTSVQTLNKDKDKRKALETKLKKVEFSRDYYKDILYQFLDLAYPNRPIQTKLGPYSTFTNKTYYPPSLTNLIKELVKLSDTNSYYQLPLDKTKDPDGQLEQCWQPYLNLLAKAHLITFHPKDPSRFKLVVTEVWKQ